MTNKRPEVLAPAGTDEALDAALSSGADAVYLGLAEGFNARGRSTAFPVERLPELVSRCHRAQAKLYLTLNTLVFESELEPLEVLLRRILSSGVDALIVQDPATAFLARALSQKVRLHASTQMTISSPEGALFAATLGMDRVVLPRELSLSEIAMFTRESSLEAEVFVHGALCMAWSGQCLTSEAFSDRSANRGQCSQACRMPYEAVVDGQRRDLGDLRYLLSPQDLAAHEALPGLISAGIQSLKIEGRYKGSAYVGTAVESYRNWRDALLRGATPDDRQNLKSDVQRTQLTYSRGASLGFLGGDNHQKLVVATTPKHRGLELGTVREVRGSRVLVAVSAPQQVLSGLRPGQGIKFEPVGRSAKEHDPENEPGGPLFIVQPRSPQLLDLGFGRPGPSLALVRRGDKVRWTGDPEIGRSVTRRVAQGAHQRVPLHLRVRGTKGTPLEVEGVAYAVKGALNGRAVSSSALGSASDGSGLRDTLLRDKLGAWGETPFHLAGLDTSGLDPGLYLPVSELKKMRRVLAAQLDAALATPPSLPLPTSAVVAEVRQRLCSNTSELAAPPVLVPLCRTEEQLEAVLASGYGAGDEIELDWMEMVGLGRAVKRARDQGLRVTLATVRVQKPGEEAFDRRIAGLSPDGVLVRHWGALMHFAKKKGEVGSTHAGLHLHGDFSLNVTNSLTAHHLLSLGLQTLTASHDLNRHQLLELLTACPRGRVAVTLHHHIATFHNSHCVYAHLLSKGTDYRNCGRPCEKHRLALRDYAGHDHPVVVDVSCRNTVFNAFAQSAAPLVPRLLDLGVRRFRVELVWETAEEVTRTLQAYRALLSGELNPREALERASVHERYGVTTPLRVRKPNPT